MTTFKWGEYFELAKALQQNPPSGLQESALRSAISRAYYAGYHYVEAWFDTEKKKGHNPPDLPLDPSKHRAQIRRLKTYHRYGASTTLDSMRKIRNSCDYDQKVEGDLVFIADDVIKKIQKMMDSLS